MALPILNEGITFDIKIPSHKKTYKARPFLTKEEKALLYAMESNDTKTMTKAIMKVLGDCVTDLDPRKLTLFDLEYAFVQLRSNSVGETTNVVVKCVECDEENEVQFNLKDVTLEERDEYNATVPFTENILVELKYPTVGQVLNNVKVASPDADPTAEMMFELVRMSIDKVIVTNGEEMETTTFRDEAEEDQNAFIESMNGSQFRNLLTFIQDAPECQVGTSFKCGSCGHEQTREVKGLANFFS